MATFWDIEQGLIMCAVPALRVVPHYSANQTFIDFMDVLVGRPSICSTIVVGYPKMFGRLATRGPSKPAIAFTTTCSPLKVHIVRPINAYLVDYGRSAHWIKRLMRWLNLIMAAFISVPGDPGRKYQKACNSVSGFSVWVVGQPKQTSGRWTCSAGEHDGSAKMRTSGD
ncbi:hypothetical protein BKA93DRAFT_752063 [Sparassis latifolia]